MEGLSDRQAAEAVRSGIDWKYALGLDLADPGFDYSALSKFRARLIAGAAEMKLLDTMLERFKAQGLLNAVATVAPEWLREHAAPEWFDRYSAHIEESRLPKGQEAREQYAELIGADGSHLLSAIYEPSAPGQLQDLPAVEILRRTWVCQYYAQEGRLRWRKAEDLPPAGLRSDSPYDPEAHYGNKRSQTWTG